MNYTEAATAVSTNSERVELYNRYSPTPVKRFTDTKSAIRRLAKILEMAGVKNEELFWVKEAEVEASPKEARVPGPTSWMAGKKIYKITKENPRRKDTHGWKSFNVIKDGMTFEEYVQAKGRTKDLDWDAKKGHVELRD